MRNYLAVMIVIALLCLSVPSMSFAGDSTDRVKTAVDKVIVILKDPVLKGKGKEKERRAKIRQSVFEVWDFGEMAKRSLGQYWKDRTAADKKEFIDLFSDLLERSYINRIEGYSDEKIVWDKETVDGDYSEVKSHFLTKRNEEIPVNYKMTLNKGQWFVYDMVIENVSLVNNYRIQFNKVIRSTSYQDLVRKMKNKSESESFVSPGKDKKQTAVDRRQ